MKPTIRSTDPSWHRWCIGSVLIVMVTLALAVLAKPAAAQESDDLVPGAGETIVIARPTWDTGWFQAEVISQLIVELGFVVDGPTTYDNASFYEGVNNGSIDLWVNGWFPLHNQFLEANPNGVAQPIGFELRGGALQGYVIDRASIDVLGIETIADLADPEIAARFDTDNDGRADLIGCNRDWACHAIVEHHIDAFGLRGTVDQVSSDYGPLMEAAARRFATGEPVLYYNFTPDWTNGVLRPGIDVAWVPVPFSSMPEALDSRPDDSVLDGIVGCLSDPCNLGFPPNDIRAVSSSTFLEDHPAIESLLENFAISVDEIASQNAQMYRGEDSEADIEGHARAWITENAAQTDMWIAAAITAHVESGRSLAPRPERSNTDQVVVDRIRAATRPTPPFVTFDEGKYDGFTIELLSLVADELDADLELYGVTSNAKLIDEVARGAADVGAGAVALTSEREQRIDFSQAYFDSGLAILVNDDGGGVLSTIRRFLSRELLAVIATLLVALVIAAHIIWWAERRNNPEFPKAYRQGIWEALWWAAVTATTVGYGDKTPKGAAGRMFGLLWMFVGLFVLAYFTAGIASAVAIDEVEGRIGGVSDLRGQSVGVVADSFADESLALQGIATIEYVGASDAYEALRDGSIDAVVHDAPVLQHYVAGLTDRDMRLASDVFAPRGLAFVVGPDSDIGEAIDRGLIAVIESGDYERLREKWFGGD